MYGLRQFVAMYAVVFVLIVGTMTADERQSQYMPEVIMQCLHARTVLRITYYVSHTCAQYHYAITVLTCKHSGDVYARSDTSYMLCK